MLNRIKTYQQFTNEGLADKYAEREFHMPFDDFVPIKELDDEPVMKIKDVNIYKNPKSLSIIDKNVRDIGTEDGDIFIEQSTKLMLIMVHLEKN